MENKLLGLLKIGIYMERTISNRNRRNSFAWGGQVMNIVVDKNKGIVR